MSDKVGSGVLAGAGVVDQGRDAVVQQATRAQAKQLKAQQVLCHHHIGLSAQGLAIILETASYCSLPYRRDLEV